MTRILACFSALLLCCVAVTPGRAQQAAASPGITTTASPEVTEFQKLEDAWSNAINQRDQYALELVLSPLFVDVSASGDITTRNQQVADLLSSDDKTLHLEQHVITVRMLGDIAVANGTYVLQHKGKSEPVKEKGVFTHVFERARGRWMCINSQRTTVRTESQEKHKKTQRSESPFHFPLFSRDDKKN